MDFLERFMFSSTWKKKKKIQATEPFPERGQGRAHTPCPLLLQFLPHCLKKDFSILPWIMLYCPAHRSDWISLCVDSFDNLKTLGKQIPCNLDYLFYSPLNPLPFGIGPRPSIEPIPAKMTMPADPTGHSSVFLPLELPWACGAFDHSLPLEKFHSLGFLVSKPSVFLLLSDRSFSFSFVSCSFLCPFFFW